MKKNHPLVIIKELEQFVGLYSHYFNIIRKSDYLLEAKDSDLSSNFYFRIISYEQKDGFYDYFFKIICKPLNMMSINEKTILIKSKDLRNYFDSWEGLIKTYNNTKSLFDDPIYNEYYNEYYNAFKIKEDAHTRGFSSNKIIIIDNFLNDVDTYLDNNYSEKHKKEIIEIKNDVANLKDKLTTENQYIIITILCSIFAKIWKLGVPFIKGLYKIFKEKMVEGIVEQIVQKNLPSDLF